MRLESEAGFDFFGANFICNSMEGGGVFVCLFIRDGFFVNRFLLEQQQFALMDVFVTLCTVQSFREISSTVYKSCFAQPSTRFVGHPYWERHVCSSHSKKYNFLRTQKINPGAELVIIT